VDKTPLSLIRIPSAEAAPPAPSSTQSNQRLDLDFLDSVKHPDCTKSDVVSSTIYHNVLIDTSNETNDKNKITSFNSNTTIKTLSNPTPKELNISDTKDKDSTTENYKAILSSIKTVDLDSIDSIENLKPLNIPLEDGCRDINLTLTFGTSSLLSSHIKIAVVTLTNRSSQFMVYNYVFQLLPPKGVHVISTNNYKTNSKPSGS